MIWLAIGIAVAGFCIGYGLGEIGDALKTLAEETAKDFT